MREWLKQYTRSIFRKIWEILYLGANILLKLTKRKSSKLPYAEASDEQKVRRNWTKTLKLFDSKEYSVAIIRSATCVELSVNLAIRMELVHERGLPLEFVDRLLKNANGLRGKYQNIFLPIMAEYEEHANLKQLWNRHVAKINQHRNAVVHSGEFRSRSVAQKVTSDTHIVLTEILSLFACDAPLPQAAL